MIYFNNNTLKIKLEVTKMKKLIMKILLILLIFSLFFSGCSSLSTMIKKDELATETKMTKTVWLKPSSNKNVYLQIRNATQYSMDVELGIKNILLSKGYVVVSSPEKANYWLQANILKVEKLNLKDESSQATSGLLGAAIGGGLGAYNTGSANTGIALALIGGAAGIAIDSLTDDTLYIMITDVLVTEGVNNKEKIEHNTQVLSIANKMNLELEEAVPALKIELEKALSSIF